MVDIMKAGDMGKLRGKGASNDHSTFDVMAELLLQWDLLACKQVQVQISRKAVLIM
jgi:hypothetical protein